MEVNREIIQILFPRRNNVVQQFELVTKKKYIYIYIYIYHYLLLIGGFSI